MQIVIDIPDEHYKQICENKEDAIIAHDTCRRIAHGTPLNDVLDKIGAEIEEIETYDGLYIDRYYVLQIIDKYRG